jgi:transposase
MTERKPYPSDVNDDEWAFVAPYLALLPEEAAQRRHPLREVFDGVRNLARGGVPWRMLPNDLPPWEIVYQQTRRRFDASVFEAMVHDLRALLRLAEDRVCYRVPELSGIGRTFPCLLALPNGATPLPDWNPKRDPFTVCGRETKPTRDEGPSRSASNRQAAEIMNAACRLVPVELRFGAQTS